MGGLGRRRHVSCEIGGRHPLYSGHWGVSVMTDGTATALMGIPCRPTEVVKREYLKCQSSAPGDFKYGGTPVGKMSPFVRVE